MTPPPPHGIGEKFATSTFTHADMRAVWRIKLAGGVLPRSVVERQPAEAMLMLSVQASAMEGLVNAHDHGGMDFCAVLFNISGRQVIRGHHRECIVNPGDVIVWSSRMSCQFDVPTALQEFQILVPMNHFARLWPGLVPKDVPIWLPAGNTLGALARVGVQELWRQRQSLAQSDLRGGLEAVIDLLDKACRSKRTAPRSKTQLFDEIVQHIDGALDDPALCPTSIARRHGLSLRSLHALFAERHLTVAGLVRQHRLERCRQALRAEGDASRIGDLALQWGFSDAAHFSKLFKSTFGLGPREYRQRASTHGEPRAISATAPSCMHT